VDSGVSEGFCIRIIFITLPKYETLRAGLPCLFSEDGKREVHFERVTWVIFPDICRARNVGGKPVARQEGKRILHSRLQQNRPNLPERLRGLEDLMRMLPRVDMTALRLKFSLSLIVASSQITPFSRKTCMA
jgi:hypothetical protein